MDGAPPPAEADQGDIRPDSGGPGERPGGVGRLADDDEVRSRMEHRAQTVPQDFAVVADQHLHRRPAGGRGVRGDTAIRSTRLNACPGCGSVTFWPGGATTNDDASSEITRQPSGNGGAVTAASGRAISAAPIPPSRPASATEPAKLLAVFVSDPGETLVVPEQK